MRQQQRCAEPAHDRPEDDDRGQALRQSHGKGADRVAEQAQHVRALAPDQIAHLAADQDERRRHQRLKRDRGLNPADGRMQIVDDRCDGDVHHRCVDDQDEHRHRQQDGQPAVPFGQLRSTGSRLTGHSRFTILTVMRLPAEGKPRVLRPFAPEHDLIMACQRHTAEDTSGLYLGMLGDHQAPTHVNAAVPQAQRVGISGSRRSLPASPSPWRVR